VYERINRYILKITVMQGISVFVVLAIITNHIIYGTYIPLRYTAEIKIKIPTLMALTALKK
jgi:hypothetical protein